MASPPETILELFRELRAPLTNHFHEGLSLCYPQATLVVVDGLKDAQCLGTIQEPYHGPKSATDEVGHAATWVLQFHIHPLSQ